MKKIVQRQMLTHYAAATIGGFWGGYTIFNFMDIFANAQTGNLIKLVLSLCEGDLTFIWFMALSFLVYCGGNVFYVLIRRRVKISMKIVSMICSAAAVVAVDLIALAHGGVIACFPIMFVAPVQWNAFKIAGGNSSSTIFSSNNVRQAAILTTNYVLSRDKSTGGKAKFYWLTLLSFHLGVAFAGCTSLFAGAHSIWFCFVPIALTVCAYCRYISEKLRVAALVNK